METDSWQLLLENTSLASETLVHRKKEEMQNLEKLLKEKLTPAAKLRRQAIKCESLTSDLGCTNKMSDRSWNLSSCSYVNDWKHGGEAAKITERSKSSRLQIFAVIFVPAQIRRKTSHDLVLTFFLVTMRRCRSPASATRTENGKRRKRMFYENKAQIKLDHKISAK